LNNFNSFLKVNKILERREGTHVVEASQVSSGSLGDGWKIVLAILDVLEYIFDDLLHQDAIVAFSGHSGVRIGDSIRNDGALQE